MDDKEKFEPKAAVAGVIAAEKALKAIRERSYSERNPELGKMIKCQICQTRHRQNERNCQQVFAEKWTVDKDGNKVYTGDQLIAGRTPETETVLEEKKVNLTYGAPQRKNFSKPRRNPHPNKHKLLFIELVRKYTPDEYTQEDLEKARKRAAKELGRTKKKTWGYNPKPGKESNGKENTKVAITGPGVNNQEDAGATSASTPGGAS